MRAFFALCALLALSNFGGEATETDEVFRYAMTSLKLKNEQNNCYLFYGIPKIGTRLYNSSSGIFSGPTTWSDVCMAPWGRNEQDTFCRSFGLHAPDETWPTWILYDNIFNATNGAAGCNSTTDASLTDCDLGTGRTLPSCNSNTGTYDSYYSSYDTPSFTVRPVVYCQVSTSGYDVVQCLNSGDPVMFSQLMYWKGNGKNILTQALSGRKKRAVGFQIEAVNDLETVEITKDELDPSFEVFPSENFPNKRETKNFLLQDPDEIDIPWMLEELNIDVNLEEKHRSKRAIPTALYCGNRDKQKIFDFTVECECSAGWRGVFCESDIDECAQTNTTVCAAPQTCMNTVGSYICNCPSGYMTDNMGNCTDINECDTDNGCCQQVCNNYDGGHNCSCNAGYTLLLDNKSCQDIDECENVATTKCDTSNSNCINTYGSYKCSCFPGFKLNSTGSCDDINECDASPCTADATCTNTIGSYTCTCPDGTLEINGECKEETQIVTRTSVRLEVVPPGLFVEGSETNIAFCAKFIAKTVTQGTSSSVSVKSRGCKVKQRNAARRKRQSGQEFDVEITTVYNRDLSLAEKSQETVLATEALTAGAQTINLGVINGTDYGNATVSGQPQLIEAPGVNVNQTAITEICYLYNLVQHCKEGSSCVESNGMPSCECAEGFTGEQCTEQVVSAISTSTIFLLAACIGLFLALVALVFSHIYHMKRFHELEKFVGFRYYMSAQSDNRYPRPYTGPDAPSSMGDTLDQPRSWLPQPMRRHHGQQPAYFSHWN